MDNELEILMKEDYDDTNAFHHNKVSSSNKISVVNIYREKYDYTFICHVMQSFYYIEAEIKWPPFRRRHFQMNLREWEY